MSVAYRRYKKMTKAERAAAYAKRANPNRIKKEENFKKLIDEVFRTQNWDSFRSNRRGAGGIIPLQYITEFNEAIKAGPNSKEFKDLLRFTGRTKEEILKLDRLRPDGVPTDVRSKAAKDSYPEERKLTPEKKLEKEQKTRLKRSKRLDRTVGEKAKYLRGTDAFPFHHIMPIGGEAQLTSNDIAVLSKQMNSKIAPYNTKLNDIADAISDNISKAFTTRSEGGSFEFMKRIDELNDQAEKLVAKATKELPKKFQPYIGFTKLTPRTDEYGFPLDDNLIEERVGAVREKGIPLRDLSNEQLTKLKNSIKSLTEKEKIGYCSLLSRGGLPGDCAAAIDNDPVKAAQIFDQAPATSSAMTKVKNAALGFLKSSGVKTFGIGAGIGTAVGLVKLFKNDDPTTYLSNEDQQKSMLVDMATQPVSIDTERPAILDYQLPALGATIAGSTALAAPSTIKASKSRSLGIERKPPGIAKTGLRVLGRGLGVAASPALLAPFAAGDIASQIAEGDTPTDIATDPLNYLYPAFAEQTPKLTRGLSPTLRKVARLGLSGPALRILSRAGIGGFAASAAIQGLGLLDD